MDSTTLIIVIICCTLGSTAWMVFYKKKNK